MLQRLEKLILACFILTLLACGVKALGDLPGPQGGGGGGAADGSTLTGTTLASNIVTSSLTAFGNSPTSGTTALVQATQYIWSYHVGGK